MMRCPHCSAGPLGCGCAKKVSEPGWDEMWEDQASFVRLLQEKRGFPETPVDLTSKAGQTFVKRIIYEAADELHEVRGHLRNSKAHRATEVEGFDREAYVEEISDVLHYLIEVCIVSGVTADELKRKYLEKGRINRERIANGY